MQFGVACRRYAGLHSARLTRWPCCGRYRGSAPPSCADAPKRWLFRPAHWCAERKTAAPPHPTGGVRQREETTSECDFEKQFVLDHILLGRRLGRVHAQHRALGRLIGNDALDLLIER